MHCSSANYEPDFRLIAPSMTQNHQINSIEILPHTKSRSPILDPTRPAIAMASCTKSTSPARSLAKRPPPTTSAGLESLEADSEKGQAQVLEGAVFFQCLHHYLAVDNHDGRQDSLKANPSSHSMRLQNFSLFATFHFDPCGLNRADIGHVTSAHNGKVFQSLQL